MDALSNSSEHSAAVNQEIAIKYEVHLVIYDFVKLHCALSPIGLGLYHTAIQLKYHLLRFSDM